MEVGLRVVRDGKKICKMSNCTNTIAFHHKMMFNNDTMCISNTIQHSDKREKCFYVNSKSLEIKLKKELLKKVISSKPAQHLRSLYYDSCYFDLLSFSILKRAKGQKYF